MDTPYYQYKDYMKARYGEPLYRVPIDFQSGCPHREADGTGGCTFCSERGSRAVQTLGRESIAEQTAEAVRFARERYGAKKFMAYIQAFTAYFTAEHQALYRQLLEAFDFTALSIGTRPDCLTPQAYEYLVELNRDIEVWVELGVQTVHERTLKRINRGHGWAICEKAIRRLHELDIKVIVHVILGLPGETEEHFQQTADTLAALPIDAVKIHNLHIEKGTILADQYAASCDRESTQGTRTPTDSESLRSCAAASNAIHPMMEHEFAEHLMDFIRRMPPGIPILRITADTQDAELIAPRWHMAKGQFIDYVQQQMICREWRQGDLYPRGNSGEGGPGGGWQPVETADGSITFWNREYKEHYHTPAGARLEAEEKYLAPARLEERLARGDVELLDVCFGLGYNSLAALELSRRQSGILMDSARPLNSRTAPSTLSITALEMDRRVVGAAARQIQAKEADAVDWPKTLTDLHDRGKSCVTKHASIDIYWGDARHTVTQLVPERYDLVFLDAFSTQRNSELWTVDFFRKLRSLMKPDAVLLTYCAALPVRAGLIEAGFCVGETSPVGRQRGGTIAAMRPGDIAIPLPGPELRTLRKTTRGLPYRDPHGVWTNKEILRNRQQRILDAKVCDRRRP